MPGYLLTSASTVQCPHGGMATAIASNIKVRADGSSVLVERDLHTVAGCPFTIGVTPSPCLTISWSAGASKVKLNNVPVLVQSSIGHCKAATSAVQGLALVANTQTKVKAL